jgi:hypothetical protein
MLGSAVVLVLGLVLAVGADNGRTTVTIAALSAFASAVGGYIATTFLRSYEISVRQAESYFREPMVAGYLYTAEQATRGPDGQVDRTQLPIVIKGYVDAAVVLAGGSTDKPKS